MIPVVLSGGSGSRLWPISRDMYPKQLLSLFDGDESMLQTTVNRVEGICDLEHLIVVCNNEHRFIVGQQLSQASLEKPSIILEPEGKNTAPATAISAFHAQTLIDDPILLVMPADHVISDQKAFSAAMQEAEQLAKEGKLVTFGIKGDKPETGYGYIQAGSAIGPGFEVADFKEKPTREIAETYLNSGNYYWNSGIFAFKASVYLAELEKFANNMYQDCRAAYEKNSIDLDFIRVDEQAFAKCKSESIDYAVMEHTSEAVVVPVDMGWNDVGSWSALWDVSEQDEAGNSQSGDVMMFDCKKSYVYSQTKLVAGLGLDNMVVVETDDAVLVAPKEKSQDVKKIVSELKQQNRSQVQHHRKVYRPWGWYDSVDSGDRFQVKRLHVNPGAKLSVQLHHKRAEHWVVVKGTAEVLNGDEVLVLHENQSTYIPIGAKHALHNPSETESLQIIEVQSGSYLGEDDIVRFEDNYGRV